MDHVWIQLGTREHKVETYALIQNISLLVGRETIADTCVRHWTGS